MDPNSNIASI